ncbi:MAG: bifunctional UDP-N-acetylglucosamine diphosphorylase/glucosamine-1-phosphate N-acetyltransferase GlmU [Microthrixaceae bacterium]
MSERRLSAIVLAAGEGSRMRSARPKPLHLLCGRAMVLYVLDALPKHEVDRAVIVVGHGAEQVTKKLMDDGVELRLEFVEQHQQRGTGDAVEVGLSGLSEDDHDDDDVLVLPGDTPLLRSETVAALVAEHRLSGAACTILTARMDDPTGYGRILRTGKDERIARIVEQADATPEEAAIDEVNTGIFCFRRSLLSPALRRINPDNAQGELYLTDVVEVLAEAGHKVVSVVTDDGRETQGVNDRSQLAAAEADLRARTNFAWQGKGVTRVDPDTTYIDAAVDIAPDVTLFPGTILQGRTTIGAGTEIGPGCRLVDCTVGERSTLEHTIARRSDVGDDCHVGPYAGLEPGTHLRSGTRTGAFYTGGTSTGADG